MAVSILTPIVVGVAAIRLVLWMKRRWFGDNSPSLFD